MSLCFQSAAHPKKRKMFVVQIHNSLMFNDVKVQKKIELVKMVSICFAMKCLNGGRIGIASQALGILQELTKLL
jgi:alkylation response protein AidB-like acyl-CoA dehydrogenase